MSNLTTTTRKRKTLEAWIAEAWNDPHKTNAAGEPTPIRAFVCVHLVGTQEREVHTYRVGGDGIAAAVLAQVFRDKCEIQAQDSIAAEHFAVIAFYGEDGVPPTPGARFPFTVQPNPENVGFYSEGPDEAGRTRQGMRHSEMLVAQVYRRQAAIDAHAIQLQNEMSRQLVDVMRENRALSEGMLEIAREQTRRNHEYEMQRITSERNAQLLTSAVKFLPPLANTIMGREVFPQSTEDTAIVEGVAEHVQPEHLAMLASVLPDHVAGPLISRIQRAHEEKARAAAEAERVKKLAAEVDMRRPALAELGPEEPEELPGNVVLMPPRSGGGKP